MLSPTVVVAAGPGLGSDSGALDRLQAELSRQPGVQTVIGPADDLGAKAPSGLVFGAHGNGARYVVVLRSDPFGAAGIHAIAHLRAALPALADRAGLHRRWMGVGGNTALAQETTGAMRADVLRVALVAALVNVVLLAIFLRALVAPVLLVGASALTLGAALGITAWTFSNLLGYGENTYYVPYAVAVLLVSLGSDYNVFVTGRMWQEARRRPLRDAVAVAGPRAAEAIRTAGLALAASFAAIALIPVRGFREFAFAMVVGILLETFLVRSLLVPALISLVGYASGWPGKALRRGARMPAEPRPDP
jgi:RND superfamily putative drug exporter